METYIKIMNFKVFPNKDGGETMVTEVTINDIFVGKVRCSSCQWFDLSDRNENLLNNTFYPQVSDEIGNTLIELTRKWVEKITTTYLDENNEKTRMTYDLSSYVFEKMLKQYNNLKKTRDGKN